MSKPYIDVDTNFPGIVSLFMFDKEVAKPLGDLAEVLLRRPSSLEMWERELIASFVSKLNQCNFCYGSHFACTKELLGDNAGLAEAFLEDEDSEVLTLKLRTLLIVALGVQSLDRENLPTYIFDAKMMGASDQDIHDTVAIAAAFCMFNRYVDGLGTTYQPGDLEKSGKSIATLGYKMGFRRLFGEILPQLWRKFRS